MEFSCFTNQHIPSNQRENAYILKQFKNFSKIHIAAIKVSSVRCGIKSVINLQHPGEHASCGFGLEESGFSYNPEDFMQADSKCFLGGRERELCSFPFCKWSLPF